MFLRVELIILVTATVIILTKGQNCPIQCEQITTANCQQGLSYTTTGFPNYLDHADQNDQTLLTLSSLIPTFSTTGCYPQSKAFLCGLLVPECATNVGITYPSRAMCDAFKSGCSNVLALYHVIQLDCSSDVFMDNPMAQCNTVAVPTLPALPTTRNPMPTLPALPSTPGPSTMTNSAGNMTVTTPACGIPCESITITQCTGQSYSTTGFPNIFNQTRQADVAEFAAYISIATTCYANAAELLCRLLLPECRVNEGLVYPDKQMCEEFLTGCGTLLASLPQASGLDIDCTLFVETSEPVCYAQPPVLTTEKPAMIPTTDSGSGQGSGSGQTKCPQDQKCSAFSINCGQNTMILLILVFLMKVM